MFDMRALRVATADPDRAFALSDINVVKTLVAMISALWLLTERKHAPRAFESANLTLRKRLRSWSAENAHMRLLLEMWHSSGNTSKR